MSKRSILGLMVIFALAGCGSDDPSDPGSGNTTTIHMTASTFSPADVTVTVGRTVRWVNDTPIAHTITPNNATQAGVWSNVQVPAQQNFAFSHTFSTAGTFNYTCTLHAGMTGRITVQ